MKADITDEAQVRTAIETATSMGTLRVAVSCAGAAWAARTVNREGEPHALHLF